MIEFVTVPRPVTLGTDGLFAVQAGVPLTEAMDALGVLLYTAVLALVTWRVAVGGIDIYAAGERSMLMDLPLWIPYLLMLPGLALCVLIGLVQCVRMAGGRALGTAA